MEFCNICDSMLLKKNNFKCPKCEQIPTNNESTNSQKKTIDDSFPFVKNQYYPQKEIRTILGTDLMSGISWNKTKSFLVLFRNARKPIPKQNNVYHDRYDSQTRLYYYTGKGRTGAQTISGINGTLKNATKNGIKVHLFWQYNYNSDHQYVGEVQVIETKLDMQPDSTGVNRNVYLFVLQPK
jgi:hypothetical protein